jgi:hypothetical protein
MNPLIIIGIAFLILAIIVFIVALIMETINPMNIMAIKLQMLSACICFVGCGFIFIGGLIR